ncbi:winged helix-turn-helix domain-containing protein [Candidatus Bathyarchaeota archaeon]|nr:winged helix-turn-helix domain-containing protein [Candidatus Bathyarchaeota archaeon]
MVKDKDRKIKEAQGQASRLLSAQNQLRVFQAIAEKPSTYSELLRETGLSRPVLMKHLKALQEQNEIFKDTIKHDETSNPKEIGKVVYRVDDNLVIPHLVRAMAMALQIPKPEWDKETKAEVRKHFEGLAKVIVKEWKKIHPKPWDGVRITKAKSDGTVDMEIKREKENEARRQLEKERAVKAIDEALGE